MKQCKKTVGLSGNCRLYFKSMLNPRGNMMDKADLVEYYGSVRQAAKAAGRSKSTFFNWPDPPAFEIQCMYQVLTDGALKADRRNPRFHGNALGREVRELNSEQFREKALSAVQFKNALRT